MRHPFSSVFQDDVTITDIINGSAAAAAAMSASAVASSTASTGSAASGMLTLLIHSNYLFVINIIYHL